MNEWFSFTALKDARNRVKYRNTGLHISYLTISQFICRPCKDDEQKSYSHGGRTRVWSSATDETLETEVAMSLGFVRLNEIHSGHNLSADYLLISRLYVSNKNSNEMKENVCVIKELTSRIQFRSATYAAYYVRLQTSKSVKKLSKWIKM